MPVDDEARSTRTLEKAPEDFRFKLTRLTNKQERRERKRERESVYVKLNKTYITISRARECSSVSPSVNDTHRRTSSSRIYNPPLEHTRGCRSAKKSIGKTHRPILQFAATLLISFLIVGRIVQTDVSLFFFFLFIFLFLLFHLNKKVGTGFSVGRRFPKRL